MNYSLPDFTVDFYRAITPIFILAVGAMVSMLQSVSSKTSGKKAIAAVLFTSLILALGTQIAMMNLEPAEYLQGSFLSEALAKFGSTMIIGIAITVALSFLSSFQAANFFRGEIAALYQLVTLGAVVLVSADEVVSMFTGLEIASIGTYALVGYIRPTKRSMEGAIKYFVLGAFATAFLLMGLGLLYSATGALRVTDMIQGLAKLSDHPWVLIGAVFTIVGLSFKFALAPFHLWGPDAYEGAPTGITAFMATAIKVMVIILMLRFMAVGMQHLSATWLPGMMFVAGLSMIVGNVMALVQSSVKRMLAYSSIAHSGYMAMAIGAISVSSGDLPIAAVLFYVLGYTIISLGAFAIVMWLENQVADNLQLDDFAGLSKKHPLACLALSIFLFGLAGFPPSVGFMAKFFVFGAAVKSNLASIALVGVIGSSIAVFYYLRLMVKMYMTEPMPYQIELAPKRSVILFSIVSVAVVLSLLLGTVLAQPTMQVIKAASGVVAAH